jgi:hypothetical protein
MRESKKGKRKMERKTVFDQKRKKIVNLPKITIYQNLTSTEIFEFLIVFEICMIHNEVEDKDLQAKYLVYAIGGLAKIIFEKLRLEGLPIKKLWKVW